ncbi:MAG: preprotein translocase subunit SecG [Planctomycetes bacterium]|nr:preprotein translocase subunit SecG [Planctomycetota bacterium]
MDILLAGEAIRDLLLYAFIALSLLIIVFVLFRQTDSQGLAAAFGGGSVGGEGAFGAKTQKVADGVIGWMCFLFVLFALILASMYVTNTLEGGNSGGIASPAPANE